MSIIDEMKQLQKDMDRAFESFFTRPALPAQSSLPAHRTPVTDLQETDDAYVWTIEVPGVGKEDIEINATDTGIEVQAEHEEETESDGAYRRTRSRFYKHYGLPEDADPDSITAEHENGVLTLTAQKTAVEEDEKRRITVQ